VEEGVSVIFFPQKYSHGKYLSGLLVIIRQCMCLSYLHVLGNSHYVFSSSSRCSPTSPPPVRQTLAATAGKIGYTLAVEIEALLAEEKRLKAGHYEKMKFCEVFGMNSVGEGETCEADCAEDRSCFGK
jgi:hypothetical protein